VELDLSRNMLEGKIPMGIFEMKKLGKVSKSLTIKKHSIAEFLIFFVFVGKNGCVLIQIT
jgi:hypothetical protein